MQYAYCCVVQHKRQYSTILCYGHAMPRSPTLDVLAHHPWQGSERIRSAASVGGVCSNSPWTPLLVLLVLPLTSGWMGRQGGAWRLSALCPLHISCPAFSPHGAHVSLDVLVCYLVLEKPWDYPWSFFLLFFCCTQLIFSATFIVFFFIVNQRWWRLWWHVIYLDMNTLCTFWHLTTHKLNRCNLKTWFNLITC